MKTILAIIGFLAVVFVGYTYVNKNKEAVSETADEVAKTVDKAVSGKKAAKKTAKTEDGEKPRTPLDWSMEEIQADPITYFEYAISDAKKKQAEMKAREGEMRMKQKKLARTVQNKKKEAEGLKALLKKAHGLYKAADEKYGKDSKDWVVDFPYEGARTKRPQMRQRLTKLTAQFKAAQLVSDRTNGVNVQYENAILVAQKKMVDLETAIEHLKANYEVAKASKSLEEINFSQEEINKYLDVSEVYMEMDGGDAALNAIAQGQAIEAEYDAELENLDEILK